LQPKLVDDAIDSSFADREITLSEFLSNHLCAGLRIEESVTDDLTQDLLGAPVVAFGASFGAEEGLAAILEKKSPELEITLTAKAEFGGGLGNAFRAAFALDEHRNFTRDFVVIRDGQGAACALDALFKQFERNHRGLRECAIISLFKYGTIFQEKTRRKWKYWLKYRVILDMEERGVSRCVPQLNRLLCGTESDRRAGQSRGGSNHLPPRNRCFQGL
jgi:hypothetical protein